MIFALRHIPILQEHGIELCIPNISQNVSIKRVGKALQQCTRAKVSHSGPWPFIFTPSHAPGLVKMYVQNSHPQPTSNFDPVTVPTFSKLAIRKSSFI